MVRARNPSTAALQRTQMRRLRHQMESQAARVRIVNRDQQDDAIQQLFGVGLAMQITQRRIPQPTAARMADHIEQLQGVIRGFRAAIMDVPAEPVDNPPWRRSMRELGSDIGADRSRRTTIGLSGPA